MRFFSFLLYRQLESLVKPFSTFRTIKSQLILKFSSLIGNENAKRREQAKVNANAQRHISTTDTNKSPDQTILSIRKVKRHVQFAAVEDQMEQAKFGSAGSLLTVLKRTQRVNLQNEWGETALHVAIMAQNTETFRFLVKDAHADPNFLSYDGWTPLHFAALHGNLEMCKLLIEHGASPLPRTWTTGSKAINLLYWLDDDYSKCKELLEEAENTMRNDRSKQLCINTDFFDKYGRPILMRNDPVVLVEDPPADSPEKSFVATTRADLIKARRLGSGERPPAFHKVWWVKVVGSSEENVVPCNLLSISKTKDSSKFE